MMVRNARWENVRVFTLSSGKTKGHTTGIGLRNVDKRIKYYFEEEWGGQRNDGIRRVNISTPQ